MRKMEALWAYQEAEVAKAAVETEIRSTPARQKLNKLHKQLKSQQAVITKLGEDIETYEQQLKKLTDQVEKLEARLEVESGELVTIRQDDESTAEEMTELKRDIERLSRDIAQAVREAKSLATEIEQATAEYQKTIREAVRHQKELTPHLIGILEQAAGGPETCADRENCNGPLYALFLLAQFRETSAYPAVVNFCRIPEEPLDLLIGDVITKDLRRILASVFDGDAAPIKGLIEDPNVYGYVRGAGVEALTDLVLEGIIQREEVMAYFKELLSTRLEREPFSELWATVVCQAADLYPGEVQEEIREAFRDELLDDSWIDEMEVKAVLDKGMECCMETTRASRCDSTRVKPPGIT